MSVVESGGTDLALSIGAAPLVRIDGRIRPAAGLAMVDDAAMAEFLRDLLTAEQLEQLWGDRDIDFAFSWGAYRFRGNAFFQRGQPTVALRLIQREIPTFDEIGLPYAVRELIELQRGLILFTGPTGSGKSTTMATLVDAINAARPCHILTIEDPIEYLHRDRHSIINQREVGMDTESFGRAMRRVLRQDPDVILIGEMRDEETVRTALSAAETGHLVLSTVHTLDAAESVNRIIDFFQPHEQSQARAMLAGTLRAVVSQRLVRTADHTSRVAVCEILRMTGRARDMILDPDQTDRLREVIAEGEYYGMQTFDQALLGHYQAGRVSMEDALRVASSPHDFKLLVAGEGRTATSMDDLAGSDHVSQMTPSSSSPESTPEPVAVPHVRPAAPIASANGRPSAPPPGMAA
jgi:twitching motility protein PilT